MPEYHSLRVFLGLMQVAVIWVLWRRDVGYLWRFGLAMLAGAVMNIAPASPDDDAWKHFVQIPAYVIILVLTAEATLEFFAFLRRRTFTEERFALLAWAGIMGLIPVWVFWRWPGEDWYQNFMLARQYGLMWLAGAYIAAWCWLRAVRPIHMELQIADHGEFWGFWLVSSAALAASTKWGALWRFAEWQGGEITWRLAVDVLLLAQVCIGFAFALNLWNWKADKSDVAPDGRADPPAPAGYLPHRLSHP